MPAHRSSANGKAASSFGQRQYADPLFGFGDAGFFGNYLDLPEPARQGGPRTITALVRNKTGGYTIVSFANEHYAFTPTRSRFPNGTALRAGENGRGATQGIFTTHRTSIGGPDLVEGALQSYAFVELTGTARGAAQAGCGSWAAWHERQHPGPATLHVGPELATLSRAAR